MQVLTAVTGREQQSWLTPQLKGYLAISVVIFIWSGFALTMRAIGGSALTTGDVALLRFIVPLLVFSTLVPKYWPELKKVRVVDALLIMLAGVPFFLIAATGAKTTPSAYIGTILAGTPPFFVAVLECLLGRKKLPAKRVGALSLIVAGVVFMVLGQTGNLSAGLLRGTLFLLLGGFVWACFTLGVKRSGLSAVAIVILLSYGSFFVTAILLLTGLLPSNLGSFSFSQALPFILVQGFCVGVLAVTGYSYAVRQLGSAKSSTIGSLSPALTAVLAVPIFHESLSFAVLAGIAITIVGVILSNRF